MVGTEKGFTLVEVLVAMMVFSLALLGLGRMQVAAIQANTIASRLTQGTTLAQDRAEQLMALPYDDPDLADGTAVDTFQPYPPDVSSPGYSVVWEVDADAPSAGIKTINIVVTWDNLGSDKTFSLSVQKSNI